jgi:hypothetical protein
LLQCGVPDADPDAASLLIGDRAESRPGERVAIVAARLLAPLLRPLPFRPIEAR